MTPGAGIFRTTLPKGYSAAGINCGVRRYRPDLGLIVSEFESVSAGVFTQNHCKAAPVVYCEQLLPASNIRAIITNSGQANAATGETGITHNLTMARSLANKLGCDQNQVLTASTGVIGEQLEIEKIVSHIPELVTSTSNIAEKFALAILTTDLVPKAVFREVKLSQGKVKITGICKGSGMIHPNMATMLGYLLTDAELTQEQTQHMLTDATNKSFNMISVDNDTSTNDCVFLMANGASHHSIACESDYHILQAAFTDIAITLAKSIARDGEGATKLIEIQIKGAPSHKIAKQAARDLTVSPLIKTAIYGESPNWGRIIGKLGAANVTADLLNKCQIKFQGHTVYSQGQPQIFNSELLAESMKKDTILIEVDLAGGKYDATAWGCDLSERYIKINADYLS